jgi:PAS domain S-box-containing protein
MKKAPPANSPAAGAADRLLWDSVPDVLFRVRGTNGTIEFLSAAFTPLTGWPASDWIGRTFTELVYADDLPRSIDTYAAILRGERLGAYEVRIRTKDGGFVVGEFHSAPLIEEGRVVGAQGIVRDITDRRRADEARQATEARFRTLFESADEALFLMDGDTFLDINPKCIEMFGLRDRTDMIGRSPVDFSPPLQPDGRESREKAQEYLLAALQGRPQRFYWKHARKDGGTFDAEVSLTAIQLHGKAHVQAIVRDITARREAEQAMRESEERFRLLSEAAFEGIAISEHARIVDCNEDLAAMLGYTREEMIGRPVLDFVAPEHADLVAERHRSESIERYEHMARRKDGSTFNVEVQGRSLPYQDRRLRVSAIRDITERRRSELIQGALFRISEAAHASLSPQELFAAIHRIVGELMPARNFYIALYDADSGMLSFPYFVDEFDPPPAPKPPGKGLTEYVLRTGRPLLATPEVSLELERRGEMELIGAPSVDWLGVPLVAAGKTTGVLVVQTYTEGVRYSEKDRDLLQFVSAQIAMAVQRKRAEEALRESEQRLQSLFAGIDDALFVHDGDGRIIDCNEAACRRLGYSRAELLAMRTSDIDAPEFAAGFRDRLVEQLDQHRFVCEGVHVAKDGRRIPVDVNSCVIEYHGKRAVLAVMRDITDHKRAEEALRISEASLRAFVDNAVFGISRSSADGTVATANQTLARMLGYRSPDELIGLTVGTAFYRRPEDREATVALMQRGDRFENLEAEWKRKDGTPLTVRLSGRAVRAAGGAVEGYEVIIEDITERRTLEAQLRQAQKMEAVGQLAGGVAHDFNNLLTTILASSELLAAGLPAGIPHREDVEMIHQAAQRAAELTRDLLAFSRQQPLELQAVPLGGLVADFARLARRIVPEDVEVTVRVEAPGAVVRADPGAIEQILMNLVTNSRDAMPGGGALRLVVGYGTLDQEYRRTHGWGTPGEYVMLSVADTGAGMDQKTQQHIFEPFFTTKPVGQGTGLGMAMVYGLVKQHGGFISVYSEPGLGTTVHIYFPAISEAASPKRAAAAAESAGGRETILLVEDDATLRRTARRVLERFGYTVVTATDGLDALNIVQTKSTPADLIISDVVMPHASGPQLLSALRDSGAAPRMLFTSGYAARDVQERVMLESGVPFLAKPWTIAELLRKVREVLDAPVPEQVRAAPPALPPG